MNSFTEFTNRYNNTVSYQRPTPETDALTEYIQEKNLELDSFTLMQEYYLDPLGKDMYSIFTNLEQTITSDSFQFTLTSNHRISSIINYPELYEKLSAALYENTMLNPIPQLFKRYLHARSVKYTVPGIGLDYFIVRNKLLCSNAKYNPQLESRPLTETNFTSLIRDDFKFSHYTRKDILLLWKKIKNLPALPVYPKDFYLKRIYDNSGNFLYCDNKMIKLQSLPNADFNFRRMPQTFLFGHYNFSDALLNVLTQIINNSITAFDSLAELVASAYSNLSPLKRAIIIKTTQENINEVRAFFNGLFPQSGRPLSLSMNIDIKTAYAELIENTLNNVPVYFVEEDTLPKNCDSLKKLVSSHYITVCDGNFGNIQFKNTIPLLLITANDELAKSFSIQIPSEIIATDDSLIKTDGFLWADYLLLRQALAIRGLKLFGGNRRRATTTIKCVQNDATNEFIENFCTFSKGRFTRKQIIKDAFNRFLTEKYPHLSISPLAICNALRDRGCQIDLKKRVDGCRNPVAVICDVALNFDYFEQTMVKIPVKENSLRKKKFQPDELRIHLAESIIDQINS